MHFGHAQAGKCEQGAEHTAAQRQKEFDNNFRSWTTAKMRKVINQFNWVLRCLNARRGQTLLGEKFRCAGIKAGIGILQARLQYALINDEDNHGN